MADLMPPLPSTLENFDDEEELFIGEEPIFSRDASGQLIPLFTPTEDDLRTLIAITIDGMIVRVPKAVESRDSQGNILRDARGIKIIRPTTIYDAEVELRRRLRNPDAYEGEEIPVADATILKPGCYQPADNTKIHIPVLCHQEHLNPVAVCRACVVQLMRKDPKKGTSRPERKLLPACQHLVRDGMEVHTMESPVAEHRRTVRTAVQNLVEMLSADHLDQDPARRSKYRNELDEIRNRFKEHWSKIDQYHRADPAQREAPNGKEEFGEIARFGNLPIRYNAKPRSLELIDESSPSILVDRNNCILCDRCVRACSEVKPFKVIGRTGKGHTAAIAFDLNMNMGESSCRTCGECMVACPTGALTFKLPVFGNIEKKIAFDETVVETRDLLEHPSGLFGGMSFAFLEWNRGAILRKQVQPGEMLCRQGDYGASAYILEQGRFVVLVQGVPLFPGSPLEATVKRLSEIARISVDKLVSEFGGPVAECTSKDVILGEMSPMSNDRRNATIFAVDGGQVLDVKRNILYMLQRNETAREKLNDLYRDRAIARLLSEMTNAQKGPFKGLTLSPDQNTRLKAFFNRQKGKLNLRRYTPNEIVCSEGAEAVNFYYIRLGFVNVVKRDERSYDQVLITLSKEKVIGDVAIVCEAERKVEALKALLARNPNPAPDEVGEVIGRGIIDVLRDDIGQQRGLPKRVKVAEAMGVLLEKFREGMPTGLLEAFRQRKSPIGRRTATCVALDNAELISIPGNVFEAFVLVNPDIFEAFDASSQNIYGGPKK